MSLGPGQRLSRQLRMLAVACACWSACRSERPCALQSDLLRVQLCHPLVYALSQELRGLRLHELDHAAGLMKDVYREVAPVMRV